MSSEKKIRLQQVAREFKVGFGTVVDFLARKGVNIDATPSTLIDGDTYALIEKEFGGGQRGGERANVRERMNLKQESVSLNNKKEAAPEEEEVVVKSTTVSPREEVRAQQPKILGKIDLSTGKKVEPAKPAPAPKQEAPKAAPAPKKEEPKPAPAPAPAPAKPEVEIQTKTYDERMAESREGLFRADDSERLSGPKVLGKIDVADLSSSRPGSHREKRKRIGKVDVNKAQQGGGQPQQGGGKQQKQKQQGGGAQQQPQQPVSKKEKKKKAPKPVVRPEVSDEEVQKQIKDTLARLTAKGGKSKGSVHRKEKRMEVRARMEEEFEQAQMEEKVLKVTEFVTVSELATMMNVSVTEVITVCMNLGLMVSINQRLDAEALVIVAERL